MRVTPYAHDGVTQDGPIAITYYDVLSRPVASDVQGFDGPSHLPCGSPCWVRAATQYDTAGNVAQSSRPYFVTGGSPQWTINSYLNGGLPDPYGRPTLVTFPDSSHTQYAYTGLGSLGSKTTVANALSQTTATVTNAQGLNIDGDERAEQDHQLCLRRVRRPAFHDRSFGQPCERDLRPARAQDRHRGSRHGTWQYSYDTLGELLSQTDAKGQTTTFVQCRRARRATIFSAG